MKMTRAKQCPAAMREKGSIRYWRPSTSRSPSPLCPLLIFRRENRFCLTFDTSPNYVKCLSDGQTFFFDNEYNLRAPENVIVNNLLPDGSFPEHPAVVVRSDLFLAQVENWRLEVLYESQSSNVLSLFPSPCTEGQPRRGMRWPRCFQGRRDFLLSEPFP